MANPFSLNNILNGLYAGIAQQLSKYIQDPLGKRAGILTDYYNGDQRQQLRVTTDPKTGREINDNITLNDIGLVVQRSTSRLFKGGIKFMLPEGSQAQQEYLDNVWDLNKKEIILFHNGLLGAVHGTVYFKIVPDGVLDPYTNLPYPRLVPISHRIIRVNTHPEDVNEVEEYRIEYTCMEQRNGNNVEVTHLEITKHPDVEVEDNDIRYTAKAETWVIETWEKVGSAPGEMTYFETWNYPFPPIIHWQNLPVLEGVYGDSEIDDLVNPQDKINFTVSNTGKIIKVYAHPETIITGLSLASLKDNRLETSVGTLTAIPDKEAKAYNLEMQSDLASSRLFAQDLRDDLFNIAREPNVSIDKMGAFTNFALRIIYGDALDKNDTKRQLYGDALLELNRRLLVLKGWTGEASRPGTIQWGEVLPINPIEEMTADEKALSMGVVDLETVAKRWFTRYGVDWETIQANKEKNKPEPLQVPDVTPQDNNMMDSQNKEVQNGNGNMQNM